MRGIHRGDAETQRRILSAAAAGLGAVALGEVVADFEVRILGEGVIFEFFEVVGCASAGGRGVGAGGEK
jgi:hypothetical protein